MNYATIFIILTCIFCIVIIISFIAFNNKHNRYNKESKQIEENKQSEKEKIILPNKSFRKPIKLSTGNPNYPDVFGSKYKRNQRKIRKHNRSNPNYQI